MKFLSMLSLLLFALTGFASTDSKSFLFDGSQDFAQIGLAAEKTHTEYRYEQRPSICYRQDVRYETRCYPGPHGRPVCSTTPVVISVPYSCLETVRIAYEVKDYDVEANLSIKVINPTAIPAAENFRFVLSGDELSVSATGSKRFFILLKRKEVNSEMSGSVKFITGSYTAELVESAPVLRSLNIGNMVLAGDSFNFGLGPIDPAASVGVSLEIKKSPILGSDTVLFDRELSATEVAIQEKNGSQEASVSLSKLGVQLSSGRFKISPRIFFKYTGTLLNASQFDKIEATRTLLLKQ